MHFPQEKKTANALLMVSEFTTVFSTDRRYTICQCAKHTIAELFNHSHRYCISNMRVTTVC